MRNHSEINRNVSVPLSEKAWDIRSVLHYEQERQDVVSVSYDWKGAIPGETLDAVT